MIELFGNILNAAWATFIAVGAVIAIPFLVAALFNLKDKE